MRKMRSPVLIVAVALARAVPVHADPACGADCNGDGRVDISDAVCVVAAVLNVTREALCPPPWKQMETHGGRPPA